MNLFSKKFLLVVMFVFISINSLAADERQRKITIMTEVYPPYNMVIDGKLTGLSVDVLEAMLQVLDIKQTREDFILSNWSRAYSMAEKRKNHMVFSTTRTVKRESLFKWVGPISTITIGIIAQKNKGIAPAIK